MTAHWKTSAWFAAGIGLMVAVGAAGWSLGKHAGHPKRGGSVAPDSEVEALRQRIQRLEDKRSKSHTRAANTVAQVALAANELLPVASAPPPPQREENSAIPSSLDQYNALEAEFATESVDSRWARPTEAQISGVITQFKGVELVSSACHSTMCRVEVKLSDRAARESFESGHAQSPPFSNTAEWIQRFRGEDGSFVREVLLVSRGGPLPTL